MSLKTKKFIALVVDDEPDIRASVCAVIKDEGWEAQSVSSAKQALDFLKSNPVDIVFMDVWMPSKDGKSNQNMDGIEALQKIRETNRQTPVVIMSGHAKIETAVRATKFGAIDFLEKPLSITAIVAALEKAKHERSNQLINTDLQVEILGSSDAIEKVKQQLLKLSQHEAAVLITGENGTGKEVLARLIHQKSPRSNQKFVAVNCAAIPEELIESELFGHQKGAFTSAIADKEGKFELADQGTLFLDEIGDMSLKTQAKILRVLETQEIQKIGSNQQKHVNVRIIAATNKNLTLAIAAGEFREDLFYRLNVVPIHLPALRDRGKDIEIFVKYFSQHLAQKMQEPEKTISVEAMNAFCRYSWPGNVRELKNLIERIYILTADTNIQIKDLPDFILSDDTYKSVSEGGSGTLKDAKVDFERNFILKKLQENDWNISKTAQVIGLERSHLHRKIKAYQIENKNLKE